MPKVLNLQELYRLIQRELPEGVYPDGAPSAYFSTADSDATAKVLESLYQTLDRVYLNYFPQDTQEKINDWEVFVFGKISFPSLTLAQRRQKVLAQIRERLDLSQWTVITKILELLPFGTKIQALETCHTFSDSPNYCWKLSRSKLSHGTRLGPCVDRLLLTNFEEYCSPKFYYWTLGRSKLGNGTRLAPVVHGYDVEKLSSRAWHKNQFKAYFYYINIFDYTLSSSELEAINTFLQTKAIARSAYKIQDNQSTAVWHRTVTVTEVDRFTNLDTVYKDIGSGTGYSGRKDTL